MSEVKGKYFKVLDKGFISLVDYMGDDQAIEQAARVSYGKGTRKVSDTRNLVRYLIRNSHSSPLEMGELKFHIKCPIFVARQWFRHRAGKYSEESGRYSVINTEFYTPEKEQYTLQSKDNKQGRSDNQIGDGSYDNLKRNRSAVRLTAEGNYNSQLEVGVSRELARIDLPLSTYTQFYFKIDLRNLLHFMSLRCDKHAQYEIRVYADIIAGIVKELFPLTFEAWYDYTFKAVSFSRLEMELVKRLMDENDTWLNVDSIAEELGVKGRELVEFKDKFDHQEQNMFNLDELEIIDV